MASIPRPQKLRCIRFEGRGLVYSPIPRRIVEGIIEIDSDELEAIRLVDYTGMKQEEAAKEMGISRGTVWRLLHSGRKKVSAMLIEKKVLVVKE